MYHQPPLQLYHQAKFVGSIVTYSYETPWASGRIEPVDQDYYTQLTQVFAFLCSVENLPEAISDEEADLRYDAQLAACGLPEALVQRYWSGWTIMLRDGSEHEVSAVVCEADMIVMWRW